MSLLPLISLHFEVLSQQKRQGETMSHTIQLYILLTGNDDIKHILKLAFEILIIICHKHGVRSASAHEFFMHFEM